MNTSQRKEKNPIMFHPYDYIINKLPFINQNKLK